MAEEPQKSVEEVAVAVAEKSVVEEKEPEKPVIEAEPEKPIAESEKKDEEKPAGPTEEAVEEKKPKAPVEERKITQSVSFKEETYVVADLPEAQKKALDELKQLIQEALNKHEFTAPPPPPPPPAKEEEEKKAPEEEKKEEEKPAAVEEKTEAEPSKEVAVFEEPAKVEAATVSEQKKEEEKPAPEAPVVAEAVETVTEEKKEEEKPTPEVAVVTEVVEKVSTEIQADSKTVETIKETIVSVSEEAAPETKDGEAAAPPPEKAAPEAKVGEEVPAPPPPPPEEVSIWGIPLLADERSDVILLKFLRARDFKVKDAFTMIKNTVRWRKEFGIDALVEEDLGNDWDKVVFTHGYDKQGHSVCYNVFGEFENKELYQSTFSDEEKRQKFIRWRIQFLEKSVRKFDYAPTGISTIVQVNDLRNSPGLGKKELRQATNQALHLLQDNYPEFLAKQVFINVPWWYLAFARMISPFLTQRTKSKFVFAGPSKSAETLFKYIAPEHVPVQYGGLSREGDYEFTTADSVTEFTIKPSTKHIIEFPASEPTHLFWELRVVGWDVSYGAEFVPSAEDRYTVIVQKSRKIGVADETIISNDFKIGEAGKVVLTIDNQTSKKKKLLYRSKTKPLSE
ncbi:patellin-3-like [Prosopis cineraria]|uniref:patellin-3-like n=1 Tax=Prosopis cineraria TaxID=364024 RepID=UPI00240F810E|nr:patellin-3-like [Prosopis cineraria]